MQNIIKASRNVVAGVVTDGALCMVRAVEIEELRNALVEYERQRAKYAQRAVIVMKKCLRIKAKEGTKTLDIIVEPGDKARVVGWGLDRLIVESLDPAKLSYSVLYVDEKVTWEYHHERSK